MKRWLEPKENQGPSSSHFELFKIMYYFVKDFPLETWLEPKENQLRHIEETDSMLQQNI